MLNVIWKAAMECTGYIISHWKSTRIIENLFCEKYYEFYQLFGMYKVYYRGYSNFASQMSRNIVKEIQT